MNSLRFASVTGNSIVEDGVTVEMKNQKRIPIL